MVYRCSSYYDPESSGASLGTIPMSRSRGPRRRSRCPHATRRAATGRDRRQPALRRLVPHRPGADRSIAPATADQPEAVATAALGAPRAAARPPAVGGALAGARGLGQRWRPSCSPPAGSTSPRSVDAISRPPRCPSRRGPSDPGLLSAAGPALAEHRRLDRPARHRADDRDRGHRRGGEQRAARPPGRGRTRRGPQPHLARADPRPSFGTVVVDRAADVVFFATPSGSPWAPRPTPGWVRWVGIGGADPDDPPRGATGGVSLVMRAGATRSAPTGAMTRHLVALAEGLRCVRTWGAVGRAALADARGAWGVWMAGRGGSPTRSGCG